MRVIVAAPAKVNLGLRIGGAGAGGYHPISTLFCALDLADTIVLRSPDPSRDRDFELAAAAPLEEVPELGPEAENLAVRAARAFADAAGLPDMPHLRLVKRIPAGGGLGGGSSDAAAVLRGLRRMHPSALEGDDLLGLAAELGSDVPFFLLGSTLAHGAGRGEVLTAYPPLPARPVVLALPPFGIATGEAYGWLDEDRTAGGNGGAPEDGPAHADPAGIPRTAPSWQTIADGAVNDFHGPVFRRHPELQAVREALVDHGARPALLAGSGSTVFGVFEKPATARAAAAELRSSHPPYRVLVTATRQR